MLAVNALDQFSMFQTRFDCANLLRLFSLQIITVWRLSFTFSNRKFDLVKSILCILKYMIIVFVIQNWTKFQWTYYNNDLTLTFNLSAYATDFVI